ncbi:hypothetical protein PAGU2196_34910 [Pseudomonas sp. PAGU 2196]|uniref:hypothetical protein n=1 Tax=Pseudomonas sp. PAGU 2196 TaxID=2793997 RepID=UPI001EDECF03|nr:hypothetical protein [Pseudomonas sp. PAGU 2196]GHS82657.1 hypothetical protein PAGU2196_34910 [Pseudomonas sp. PAGU 2196]
MHIKKQLGLRHVVGLVDPDAPLLSARERCEQYLARHPVGEQLRVLNIASGRIDAACASPDDIVEALAEVVDGAA